MKRVIAGSIEGLELARAVHDVVAERWDNWDLTGFLVYLVDTLMLRFCLILQTSLMLRVYAVSRLQIPKTGSGS
jgi:hypothetical protein